MISEKTVELNLTMELINWASWNTNRTHFALAPSQGQEGILGFDTSFQAHGTGILVQYKRPIVSGSRWQWHLNRTIHLRLQTLEGWEIPVVYTFPLFHTPLEIWKNRWSLLKTTFWYRPSQINPPGGSTGFHDVNYDSSTGRWWATSGEEDVDLPSPAGPRILMELLLSENNKGNLHQLFEAFNIVMTKDTEKVTLVVEPNDYLEGLVQGISAIIQC